MIDSEEVIWTLFVYSSKKIRMLLVNSSSSPSSEMNLFRYFVGICVPFLRVLINIFNAVMEISWSGLSIISCEKCSILLYYFSMKFFAKSSKY